MEEQGHKREQEDDQGIEDDQPRESNEYTKFHSKTRIKSADLLVTIDQEEAKSIEKKTCLLVIQETPIIDVDEITEFMKWTAVQSSMGLFLC